MRLLFLLGTVWLTLSTPLIAQDVSDEVMLSDEVMKSVVSRMVKWYFKPRRTPTKIYFSDANIKKEWLPKVRGIHFVLLEDDENHSGKKGYLIDHVRRADQGYIIGFGYGEVGCSGQGHGMTWRFKVKGSRIRLYPDGGHWGWNCDAYGAP